MTDKKRELVKEFFAKEMLKDFLATYDYSDDNETWFSKIQDIARSHMYAPTVKEFKQNPDKYLGSVADICDVIRYVVTGQHDTPDLWEVMQIIGDKSVIWRIQSFIDGQSSNG